jgi:hypothetical protein
VVDDNRWKAVAAVREFGHRHCLPATSLPGQLVTLTKPAALLTCRETEAIYPAFRNAFRNVTIFVTK